MWRDYPRRHKKSRTCFRLCCNTQTVHLCALGTFERIDWCDGPTAVLHTLVDVPYLRRRLGSCSQKCPWSFFRPYASGMFCDGFFDVADNPLLLPPLTVKGFGIDQAISWWKDIERFGEETSNNKLKMVLVGLLVEAGKTTARAKHHAQNRFQGVGEHGRHRRHRRLEAY